MSPNAKEAYEKVAESIRLICVKLAPHECEEVYEELSLVLEERLDIDGGDEDE